MGVHCNCTYPLGKNDPKIGFFLYFEKFCHWVLLEMYLIKNCSEINLTGHDLGFMTMFWISMTGLLFIMNFFTITQRNQNQWIYQWIYDFQKKWKLYYVNLLRVIVKTLNHGSQWSQIIQNFILKFLKNMIKPPFLQMGSNKISPVH